MKLFSFHLASLGLGKTLEFLLQAPRPGTIQGLSHIEIIVPMTLGRRVTQASRYHPQQMAAFAAWENEEALEGFLSHNSCGMALAHGWRSHMAGTCAWSSSENGGR
jgi:hypothetical protein